MNDPIQEVIEQMKRQRSIRTALEQNAFTSSFLNNAGEVFEVYGFGTARIYMRDKRERNDLRTQADAVMSAIDCMEACPMIHKNRAIGRSIIKTLNSLEIDGLVRQQQQRHRGGRR